MMDYLLKCLCYTKTFRCKCEEGFQYNSTLKQCVDVNECDETLNLSQCDQVCINYDGGYECGCRSGYFLSDDDVTCLDIDECSTGNGNCSQICNNLQGSHTCG